MSNVKERSIGEPDPEELEALRRYEAGEPDYQPSISAENLKRELGL